MQFNALRIVQPSGREVYAFAALPDDLLRVVQVPKVRRGHHKELHGYQRPEVSSHIAEIRRYLETQDAVLPNALVIAFDERARFVPISQPGISQHGILEVPEDEVDGRLCGFVVDGQQRLAAVSSCRHDEFPMFVTALVAATEAEQRKQFVLVNRTKPLPPGLVFELLPEIEGCLPTVLAKQQLAARLTIYLNLDTSSSLFGLVRTPTCPEGVIKDNSLRRLILNSLSDGALSTILHTRGRDEGTLEMIDVVSDFWDGVMKAFGPAAKLGPAKSRLTHGVGVVSLGFVMDHLYLQRGRGEWSGDYVAEKLLPLAPFCAWTEGEWVFDITDRRQWNALQNIDRDIRTLTHFFRRLLTQSPK